MKTALWMAFVLCYLLQPLGFAQSVSLTSGSIAGRIVDRSGAPVEGATVSIKSVETGLTRNATSDGTGAYVVAALPPGTYQISVRAAGMATEEVRKVVLLLGTTAQETIQLPPAFQGKIVVRAPASPPDRSQTATAVSITQRQIEDLPMPTRDFRSLALMTPEVIEANSGRITSDGARGLSTDYNVDGASATNDFFGENAGGTRAPFAFSQASLKEFQVVRSQYSAEFGRGVGAQVNAITKSGHNTFEGELFAFQRRREWAATRPTTLQDGQPVVDSFRSRDSTQAGLALGGPMVRDRLFYFVSFDSQRQTLPIEILDFTQLSAFLSLSDTMRQQLLDRVQLVAGHPYPDEIRYNQTFDQNTYFLKFDAFEGQQHLTLRDNYTTFNTANSQTLGNLSNQGTETDVFHQLVVAADGTMLSKLYYQTLLAYSRDERPTRPSGTGPEVQVSGLAAGALLFGQNEFLPGNTRERKLQFRHSLTFNVGRQVLRAGVEGTWQHVNNLFPRNANGVYVYSTPLSFINNQPNSFRQGYGPTGGLTIFGQDTYGAYVAANVSPMPRLTLDVGARYDVQTMPRPSGNAFPQHPEFIDQIRSDRNNIAPRFGFAYDVTGAGRSILRGGIGKFYGYMPSILLSNPLTQISGTFNQITITCATATDVTCPTYPNILTPAEFERAVKISTDIVTISPDYQAQEAWRSTLQLEHQFTDAYSVALGATYARLRHVEGAQNINAVPTGVVLGGVPVYSLVSSTRRYPDMGVVRQLCSCEIAVYRALTLETHKLAASDTKASWDVSYTFAHSNDEDTNERATSTSSLFDPMNPRLSYGPSDNDIRHRLVGDLTWRFASGIRASAIATWRTGAPYNGGIGFVGIGVPGAPNGLNGLSQMGSVNIPVFVNSSGNIVDLTQANNFTRQQLADWLAGQKAHIIGRNAFRQPNWYDLDGRVAKIFGIYRGFEIEVIGEVFNLTNRKNLVVNVSNQSLFRATYTQATDRYTFGKFTTFNLPNSYANPDPRQLQVAVRVLF
jgi:carboxypeptidase family protein